MTPSRPSRRTSRTGSGPRAMSVSIGVPWSAGIRARSHSWACSGRWKVRSAKRCVSARMLSTRPAALITVGPLLASSHRMTVARLTPRTRAKSSCVRPNHRRMGFARIICALRARALAAIATSASPSSRPTDYPNECSKCNIKSLSTQVRERLRRLQKQVTCLQATKWAKMVSRSRISARLLGTWTGGKDDNRRGPRAPTARSPRSERALGPPPEGWQAPPRTAPPTGADAHRG